jgi:hypothetical protein
MKPSLLAYNLLVITVYASKKWIIFLHTVFQSSSCRQADSLHLLNQLEVRSHEDCVRFDQESPISTPPIGWITAKAKSVEDGLERFDMSSATSQFKFAWD